MQKYLFGILTLILIVGSVWLFTLFFEQYEKEIDVEYSKEAMLNPYLASQYFLEKNNVKVMAQTSVLDFSLISPDETVFLSEVDSMLLTKSQIDKALAWVKQGGFLIVGVERASEGHDSFLSRFDIEPTELEYADFSDFLDEEEDDKKTSDKLKEHNEKVKQKKKNEQLEETITEVLESFDNDTENALYTVNLTDDRGELSVEVLDDIILNHPYIDGSSNEDDDIPYKVKAFVNDDEGPRLLQFAYGEGTFIALSSAKLWQNDNIGKADHAFFLAYLVPEGSRLHFFYNVIAPSLWELLKRYFFELLIALFTLLLLWLWRASLRVQGIKVLVDGQRRVFTEHLTASAEFLASKKQYQSLLTPIKEDITAQMRPFHPGFTQLDVNAQTALISQRAELPKETVQTWVNYTNNVNNQDELIAALKLGYAIRRKL